jgi:hypothetical protein
MTTLKKILIMTVLVALPLGLAFSGKAAKGPGKPGKAVVVKKWALQDMKKFVNKTYLLLKHAKAVVKEGKVYTGKLAKAIAHQTYAKTLWKKKMYLKAVYQSKFARILAIGAIKANKKPVPKDLDFSKEELTPIDPETPPSDADLEQEVQKEMPDFEYDDTVQVSLEINLEVED